MADVVERAATRRLLMDRSTETDSVLYEWVQAEPCGCPTQLLVDDGNHQSGCAEYCEDHHGRRC